MPKLSTNFHTDEFECKCGCGRGANPGDISPGFIVFLEKIRTDVGGPVAINSGCRCPQHNEDEGGVENSVHTLLPLEAADIKVSGGAHVHKVEKSAYAHGATGVGTAKTFVHVDTHDGSVKARPSAWRYK